MSKFFIDGVARDAFKKEGPAHQIRKLMIAFFQLLNHRSDKVSLQVGKRADTKGLQFNKKRVLFIRRVARINFFYKLNDFVYRFIEIIDVSHDRISRSGRASRSASLSVAVRY